LISGVVPLFEEMEAMIFSHYNQREWQGLESNDKALAVAHYRMHRLVELHENDIVNTEIKRLSKT